MNGTNIKMELTEVQNWEYNLVKYAVFPNPNTLLIKKLFKKDSKQFAFIKFIMYGHEWRKPVKQLYTELKFKKRKEKTTTYKIENCTDFSFTIPLEIKLI